MQSAGDLAHGAQLDGQGRDVGRTLAEGVARAGAGLDRIGLLVAKEGGAVVLVALRIAGRKAERGAGEGSGRGCLQALQVVLQVVGILPGGVEADDEVHRVFALGDGLEALVELGVAVGSLGEGEFGGGGLEIVAQEGGIVTVARGVDADADAALGRE